METTDMQAMKFGQPVRNGYASEGNPIRDGLFVRWVHRTGRLNPGKYAELTDGKGKFWMVKPDALSILDKIDKSGEGAIDPMGKDVWPELKADIEMAAKDYATLIDAEGFDAEVYQNFISVFKYVIESTNILHKSPRFSGPQQPTPPSPDKSAPAKAPAEGKVELIQAAKMLAARANATAEPGGIRWEIADREMKALEDALKSNTPEHGN